MLIMCPLDRPAVVCLALVVILPAAVLVGPPRLSSVERMVSGNPAGPTDISCPGRSQFSCHGAYAHADYSDPDDGAHWQCFTLPPRIHPQRPYCATVPDAECTAKFVINNCYPPGICPKGFKMTGASINVLTRRAGKEVRTDAVCCR